MERWGRRRAQRTHIITAALLTTGGADNRDGQWGEERERQKERKTDTERGGCEREQDDEWKDRIFQTITRTFFS